MAYQTKLKETKTNQANKATKSRRTFIAIRDCEEDFELKEGKLWMKNGKFTPSASINVADDLTISDFTRCIELRNVVVACRENEAGYPTLYICGTDGDLPF